MSEFCMDLHMHFDLYKNMNDVLKYIEKNKSYTIAVTNLPDLYKKYYIENWNYKYIRLALGFHPELVAKYYNQINIFKEYFQTTRYIGEVGLDYSSRNMDDQRIQREAFNQIIDLCKADNSKIVSIHSRKAEEDCLKTLRGFGGKVIFHWYTGNSDNLNVALSRGYYFSINHQMLKSKNGKKIIDLIPLDRIIIESDAPFTEGLNRDYNLFFINDIIEYLCSSKKVDKKYIYGKLKDNFIRII